MHSKRAQGPSSVDVNVRLLSRPISLVHTPRAIGRSFWQPRELPVLASNIQPRPSLFEDYVTARGRDEVREPAVTVAAACGANFVHHTELW